MEYNHYKLRAAAAGYLIDEDGDLIKDPELIKYEQQANTDNELLQPIRSNTRIQSRQRRMPRSRRGA